MAVQQTTSSAKSHRQSSPWQKVALDASKNAPYPPQPSASCTAHAPAKEGSTRSARSSYSWSATNRVTGIEKKLVTVSEARRV